MSEIIAARREKVYDDYKSARSTNKDKFLDGDPKATEYYIYPNQMEDANKVVQEFYENKRRIVSVIKKTKVGADGLMIEIAKLMATHPDDDFVVNHKNIRILTGMSNIGWETDMKAKSPNFLKENIFHHGQLKNSNLNDLKNSLIIIDEIDTGDKEWQVLHTTLSEAGILNIEFMEKNNNYIVVISATMIKQLYHLYQWGDKHASINMTIPPSYVGHIDFLNMGIIQEFYPLTIPENAEKWIKEDIIENYKDDYRVHIVRVNPKTIHFIRDACIRNRIIFKNHTSEDRLTEKDEEEFFGDAPLENHIVIAVKGLLRRANLLPNKWKMRIGATHELYTSIVDNNVQIQGLPGRMTGYWRHILEEGEHKTGPFRTSKKAIQEYEDICKDPFGRNTYKCSGFSKTSRGKVTIDDPSFLAVHNIIGLVPVNLPVVPPHKCSRPIVIIEGLAEDAMNFIQANMKSERGKKIIMDGYIKNVVPEFYDLYNTYKIKIWNIDSDAKRAKYGLDRMKMVGAFSTETNIHKEDKNSDVLMIYPHENELILSPWCGSANL